jgi:hypothetical protein
MYVNPALSTPDAPIKILNKEKSPTLIRKHIVHMARDVESNKHTGVCI